MVDAKSVLSVPWLYSGLQRILGAPQLRQQLVDRYVRPRPGARVLDIGCGTAEIVNSLGDVEYVGYDPSPAYIEAARSRTGSESAEFHVGGVDNVDGEALAGRFDTVLALGVLHHITDREASRLFELARQALTQGGRVLTIDPALEDDQNRIARFLIRNDRGEHVRTPQGYREIARSVFPVAKCEVRHDLLNVPYTHAIVVADKE